VTAEYVKTGSRRQIAFEAAGLAELDGCGADVAELLWADDTSLATRLVDEAAPSTATGRRLGTMLARLHSNGRDRAFGQAPTGFDLDTHGVGTMGAETLPLITGTGGGERGRSWGEFYAEDRLLPYLDRALMNGSIDHAGADVMDRLADRLRDGVFDTDDAPSILHGDLWSGNILWSRDRAVLIDPASHAGHRESDLAQLAVFGAPHYDDIVAAYDETFPLSSGWQSRIGLHQLHILIVHASLFGGRYGTTTVDTAARYL